MKSATLNPSQKQRIKEKIEWKSDLCRAAKKKFFSTETKVSIFKFNVEQFLQISK